MLVFSFSLMASAQADADLDLAKRLSADQTREAAIAEIVKNGKDKLPLLLSWTVKPPEKIPWWPETNVIGDNALLIIGDESTEPLWEAYLRRSLTLEERRCIVFTLSRLEGARAKELLRAAIREERFLEQIAEGPPKEKDDGIPRLRLNKPPR